MNGDWGSSTIISEMPMPIPMVMMNANTWNTGNASPRISMIAEIQKMMLRPEDDTLVENQSCPITSSTFIRASMNPGLPVTSIWSPNSRYMPRMHGTICSTINR